MIKITVRGLKETEQYLTRINQKIPVMTKKMASQIATETQEAMIIRAPKETGFLQSNIQVRPLGDNFEIAVDNVPYAVAQELGFRAHTIPGLYFQMHYASPGTRGIKQSPLPIGLNYFVTVSKFTPFVGPALNLMMTRLESIGNRYAKEIVRNE